MFYFLSRDVYQSANIYLQEQYIFVYDALLEALKSGDTSIPCVDFRQKFLDLQRVNPDTDKTFLEEEYEVSECSEDRISGWILQF